MEKAIANSESQCVDCKKWVVCGANRKKGTINYDPEPWTSSKTVCGDCAPTHKFPKKYKTY